MSQLNPTCPSGGNWFACLTGSNFVGCCASDNACSSIGCSAGNLRPASFNPAGYATVADQSCPAGAQWWSCAANDPPFMGCCKSNPCGSGCPQSDLAAGILNPQQAQGYTNQTLPSASATATATATAAPPIIHHGPSPGVIAGIAVGAAAAVVIVATILICWWRRVKKARKYARNSEATIIRRDVFDPFGEVAGAGVGIAGGRDTKNLSSGVSQVDPSSPMPHTPVPNTPAPKYQSNKSSPWQHPQHQRDDYTVSPMHGSDIGTIKATPPPYYPSSSSSPYASQPETSETQHHYHQFPQELGPSSPVHSPGHSSGLGLSSPGPYGPVAFPPAELPADDLSPIQSRRS